MHIVDYCFASQGGWMYLFVRAATKPSHSACSKLKQWIIEQATLAVYLKLKLNITYLIWSSLKK